MQQVIKSFLHSIEKFTRSDNMCTTSKPIEFYCDINFLQVFLRKKKFSFFKYACTWRECIILYLDRYIKIYMWSVRTLILVRDILFILTAFLNIHSVLLLRMQTFLNAEYQVHLAAHSNQLFPTPFWNLLQMFTRFFLRILWIKRFHWILLISINLLLSYFCLFFLCEAMISCILMRFICFVLCFWGFIYRMVFFLFDGVSSIRRLRSEFNTQTNAHGPRTVDKRRETEFGLLAKRTPRGHDWNCLTKPNAFGF